MKYFILGAFRIGRPLVFLAGGVIVMNNELMNKTAPKLAFSTGAKRVKSASMYNILSDCVYDMNVKATNVTLMMASGLSAFSGGSSTAANGVVIALPPTYFAKSNPDIYTSMKDSMDPSSPLAQNLDSFIPTERGLRFTMLHELSHIKHSDSTARSIVQAVTMVLGYELWGRTAFLNKKMSVAGKVGTGLLIATAAIVSNVLNWWRQELRADYDAACVDENACIGGLDSYRMRDLMTEVLQPTWKLSSLTHPPLSWRKKQLQALLSKKYGYSQSN